MRALMCDIMKDITKYNTPESKTIIENINKSDTYSFKFKGKEYTCVSKMPLVVGDTLPLSAKLK